MGHLVSLLAQAESSGHTGLIILVVGATNPKDAAPGTIRGDLAIELTENLVHGSDSAGSAAREIALFFP